MEQVNLGNMAIGAGYGANISGSSRNTFNTTSKESFDKTFDRARGSSRTKDNLSSTKSQAQRDDSKQNVKQSEKTYENKEVNDKDNTQVTQKPDATTKEVNTEVQEDDDVSKNQSIEEQILALVSQALNVSVDEIKVTLSQLGLEIKDLMSQEGFSTFIGEICGQGSVAELLMNTVDLKSITTLFEDLSTLNEQTQAVGNQNITEQTLMEPLQQEGIMDVSGENSLRTDQQSNSISVALTSETDQTALNEEVTVSNIKTMDRYSEDDKASDQDLSFLQGQEEQTEDIGINVPVHNFTTTTFTQSFETEASIVTQTTTTRSAVSGEAFIEQIDFKVIGQTRELNVQLSPKELGDLNIKIVENNGVLVAEIKVDNEKAREFILSEIHLLKQNFEEQGINVADVKVDIRQDNHQSQMEQERQKSSKRIQEIISKHFSESEEEEEEAAPIVGESEIDYMV